MPIAEQLRRYLRDQRWGIIHDLLFALGWVGLVSAFFTIVDGPQWAYYLLMLTGIPTYFGFMYSLSIAKQREQTRSNTPK